MNIVNLTCPECGGVLTNLHLQEGTCDATCNFCGANIVVQDEYTQIIIHRNIDQNRLTALENRIMNDQIAREVLEQKIAVQYQKVLKWRKYDHFFSKLVTYFTLSVFAIACPLDFIAGFIYFDRSWLYDPCLALIALLFTIFIFVRIIYIKVLNKPI